jgi:hypothetical protein
MKSRTALLALGLLSMLIAAAPSAADTSPSVSPTISGDVGANGWYRGTAGADYVVLHWGYSDPANVVDHTVGCEPAIRVDGPTAGTTRTCTAYLKPFPDGGSIAWTKVIKVDADPPTGVGWSIARNADFNGWYNHPVAVGWSGSDATSGIAGCASLTYSGPDAGPAWIGGGCTDNAGNTATAPIAINYDATPPSLAKVFVTSGATSDIVRWTSTSPSDTIVVQRQARGNKAQPTVFRGSAASFADKKIQSGVEYTYSVQAYDQAGNPSQKLSVAGLPKVLTLRRTPYIPRAAQKPILRWPAHPGAAYYHVQLFRGSKRIFAAWPIGHQLGLPAAWKWNGHRYRLGPGRYRWYVWEGLGRRSFARYKTIGSAQFIIPRG